MRALLLAATLLTSACALSPQQTAALERQKAADNMKIAELLKGFTPGKPQDCITDERAGYHTTGIGSTLLYRGADRNLVYRNETNGCEGAERGDILVGQRFQQQLCRGDILRTVDYASQVQTGSCALGAFVPYTKVRQ